MFLHRRDHIVQRRRGRHGDGRLRHADVSGIGERVLPLRDPPADDVAIGHADHNGDGVVTRAEFLNEDNREDRGTTEAYRTGYECGLSEGRAAGREDRARNQGWDLEGQRELEQADSGFDPRLGPRPEYQAGYREGFRRGYRDGYGR